MEQYDGIDTKIIDTTDTKTRETFYNNLKRLIEIEEDPNKEFIDELATLRSVDNYPYESKWVCGSAYTDGEYRLIARYDKNAVRNETSKKRSIFSFFWSKKVDEIREPELESLYLYTPVRFFSTKHFTINTALGTTLEWNNMNPNMNFVIIDDIDNFLESGYGYSLADKDAYCDVTHEPLPISKNSITVFNLDTYNRIKDDKELMERIFSTSKKIRIVKGDLVTGINMILVEEGKLPFRFGEDAKYEYPTSIKKKIEKSLQKICLDYNLEYDRSHGAPNPHFSYYINQHSGGDLDKWNNFDKDGKIHSIMDVVKKVIRLLNERMGKIVLNENDYNGEWDFTSFFVDLNHKIQIGLIDPLILKSVLDEINSLTKAEIEENRRNYFLDRKKITPEISELFKDTVRLVREHEKELATFLSSSEIQQDVIDFFLAPTVEEQVKSASKIKAYYSELTLK